ncbi:MAG: hypothetical protein NTW98_02150 [Candidatus Nomurabacteria bacterium]|nr:hypothetical protein [Candidatus Nomurabacteria bacterium]
MKERPLTKIIYRSKDNALAFRDLVEDIEELPLGQIKKELAKMDDTTRQAVLQKLPEKVLQDLLSSWYVEKK